MLPAKFTLYFKTDRDELVAGSERIIEALFADIRSRSSYTVEVIGHTDRKASDAYNDKLSLERAMKVRAELVKRGADGTAIVTTGRGERDPIVATEDDVAEPRNRRVEVNVR